MTNGPAAHNDIQVPFSVQDQADMTNLLSKGVTQGTLNRYASNWKFWMTFLDSRPDLGTDKNYFLDGISTDDRRRLLVLFIFYLHDSIEKSHTSIDGIMSAVAFSFKHNTRCTESFKDPAVRLAKAGCQSLDKDVVIAVKARRLPVTFDMIQYLESILWHGQDIDKRMTFVGILLAFHFMLRCSEYVFECQKASRPDPSHALLASDVEFITTDGLRLKPHEVRALNIPLLSILHVRLVILTSKTDKHGARGGRNLIVSRRGTEEAHLIQILYEWVFLFGIGTNADDPFLSRYKPYHGTWNVFAAYPFAKNCQYRTEEHGSFLRF